MSDFDLLLDLHKPSHRQGPGGDDETRLAITLSGLSGQKNLKIADIGCGTGASTITLAKALDAEITAIDFLPAFLEELKQRASLVGVADQITPMAASMEDLPFAPASLDAIWSEGAIYNIGFETGIQSWCKFLKPGGILAVSELTWLTAERPAELEQHWQQEYPEVDMASEKIAQLETHGYSLEGYFPLGKTCWLDNYYRPMQMQFETLLKMHNHSEAAQAIISAEQAEISLYERYADFVSYGYYIARKLSD